MSVPGARSPARRGSLVDAQGRCMHWHGADDVLLIALPCCDGFWACRACHDDAADHEAMHWLADSQSPASMCGRCGAAQGVASHLADPGSCPACAASFNPRCRLHHHLYFDHARWPRAG